MPAVATVAAIAMLTIIFPGGQCGVCKMRPCYMFLVSMCSCLNCLLARPNLPVSMFTPRLSIILGHRTHHHNHQASPGRARMQGSGSLQHYFKLSRQPKWHNIFVKCLPFHWFSIYIKQFAQEIKQRTIFSLFQFNLQPASLSLTLHFIEKRIMETKRRIIDIHLTFKLKTWNVFWKETQKFHSNSSRNGIYTKSVYKLYFHSSKEWRVQRPNLSWAWPSGPSTRAEI